LFSVPVEEGGQVWVSRSATWIALACVGVVIRTSIEVEFDVCILLLLSTVVVRSTLDDLDILELEAGTGRLRDEQDADCNGCCDGECGRGEEAKDALHPD
jgi:hypothetical protein